LSYNRFSSIENYCELKFLHTLYLAHNVITEIRGLSGLVGLRELNLSYNEIRSVANLENCGLRKLNVEHNAISDLHGLRDLPDLEYLNLESNEVMELRPIITLTHLHTLLLGKNNVHEVGQLANLKGLQALRELSVSENPMYHQYYLDHDGDSSLLAQQDADIVRGDADHGIKVNKPVELAPANPISLVPGIDDEVIKSTLTVPQLFRLKVLWFVPQIWRLDGTDVTIDEKTTSTNLEGGEDHAARRSAHQKFFGEDGDGTHVLKKVAKPSAK
jgi:hypothetical protein